MNSIKEDLHWQVAGYSGTIAKGDDEVETPIYDQLIKETLVKERASDDQED